MLSQSGSAREDECQAARRRRPGAQAGDSQAVPLGASSSAKSQSRRPGNGLPGRQQAQAWKPDRRRTD